MKGKGVKQKENIERKRGKQGEKKEKGVKQKRNFKEEGLNKKRKKEIKEGVKKRE